MLLDSFLIPIRQHLCMPDIDHLLSLPSPWKGMSLSRFPVGWARICPSLTDSLTNNVFVFCRDPLFTPHPRFSPFILAHCPDVLRSWLVPFCERVSLTVSSPCPICVFMCFRPKSPLLSLLLLNVPMQRCTDSRRDLSPSSPLHILDLMPDAAMMPEVLTFWAQVPRALGLGPPGAP